MSEFFTQVECVPICSIKTLETILHNLGIKNVYQSDYLVGSKLLGKLVLSIIKGIRKTMDIKIRSSPNGFVIR